MIRVRHLLIKATRTNIITYLSDIIKTLQLLKLTFN